MLKIGLVLNNHINRLNVKMHYLVNCHPEILGKGFQLINSHIMGVVLQSVIVGIGYVRPEASCFCSNPFAP
ncbi:MAG TPA: hypothetical protein VJ844_09240 [Mucilaginibacter sp.]|nr:hypothetical protein [Mucilaginibacter sp.]